MSQPERFMDEYRTHCKALYKMLCLVYFTSRGSFVMRPRRAQMIDRLLETLVIFQCNASLTICMTVCLDIQIGTWICVTADLLPLLYTVRVTYKSLSLSLRSRSWSWSWTYSLKSLSFSSSLTYTSPGVCPGPCYRQHCAQRKSAGI